MGLLVCVESEAIDQGGFADSLITKEDYTNFDCIAISCGGWEAHIFNQN